MSAQQCVCTAVSDADMSIHPCLGLAAVQLFSSSCIELLSLYNTAVQRLEQHEPCWATAGSTHCLLLCSLDTVVSFIPEGKQRKLLRADAFVCFPMYDNSFIMRQSNTE